MPPPGHAFGGEAESRGRHADSAHDIAIPVEYRCGDAAQIEAELEIVDGKAPGPHARQLGLERGLVDDGVFGIALERALQDARPLDVEII